MNTLSRAITAQFFASTLTYDVLRAHWRALLQSDRKHELAAAHHLLYLALLGKDWRKGFTPPTNRRKLENGAFEGWVLFSALRAIHSPVAEEWLLAPFDGTVTPQMLRQIRRFLPLPNPYRCRPEEFTNTSFPFEAYNVPEATPVAIPQEQAADA